MDKEWLKYFQELEDLDGEENVVKENKVLEEAKELYDSVLNDDN